VCSALWSAAASGVRGAGGSLAQELKSSDAEHKRARRQVCEVLDTELTYHIGGVRKVSGFEARKLVPMAGSNTIMPEPPTMVPPTNKTVSALDGSVDPSGDGMSSIEVVVSTDAERSRDTEPMRDTLRDQDVTTTDLSVQHRTDPTLLSNAEPADASESQLAARVRELELQQDALLARVRLLEKGGVSPLPRPAVWLLFLPLVAFLWWLAQRLG
jgi:hypothetical protein